MVITAMLQHKAIDVKRRQEEKCVRRGTWSIHLMCSLKTRSFSNQQIYVWSEKALLDCSETAAAAKYKLFQIETGIMGLAQTRAEW